MVEKVSKALHLLAEGPPVPTNSEPRRLTTWSHRAAVVGALSFGLGLAGCGGSSDDSPGDESPPLAAPSPVPVPVPAPDAVPPEAPAGFTKSGDVLDSGSIDVGDRYTKGTRTVLFDATSKVYLELVTPPAPLTWADAGAAAASAGGALASPSTDARMTFIKQAYTSADLPEGLATVGSSGAWIGLQQASGGALPGDNWRFLDGTPLPSTSLLWNRPVEPNDAGVSAEAGLENFGALWTHKQIAKGSPHP